MNIVRVDRMPEMITISVLSRSISMNQTHKFAMRGNDSRIAPGIGQLTGPSVLPGFLDHPGRDRVELDLSHADQAITIALRQARLVPTLP